jgi:hypothetical protein
VRGFRGLGRRFELNGCGGEIAFLRVGEAGALPREPGAAAGAPADRFGTGGGGIGAGERDAAVEARLPRVGRGSGGGL